MGIGLGRGVLVLLIVGLLTRVGAAQDCTSPLYPAPIFEVGGGTAGDAVSGDFNGDSVTDIAICDATRTVRVVLGSGAFSYGSATQADTTWEAFRLAAGDLDADGDLDLVAALPNGGRIALLFNRGDGSMAPAVLLATGSFPLGLALEDFDGDGDADIAVCNARSGNVSILLNDGAGVFDALPRVAVSREPSAMAAGDVDGDGDIDLVFADWYDEFIVLANDGTAGFSVADRRPAGGPRVTRLALFDADGDGNLDAALGGFPVFGVLLFPGVGDGTFPTQTTLPLGAHAESIKPLDFDGDGDLDLACGALAREPRVLENDGGVFTLRTDVDLAPFDATQVVWSDADGDGDADLVAIKGGRLAVLENNGAGGFVLPTPYDPGDLGSSRPVTLATADIDGDGDADLVGTLFNGNGVAVAINDAGVLAPMRVYPVGSGAVDLVLGDIDADGDSDAAIALRDSNRVVLMFNDGTGRLGSPRVLSGIPRCQAVALGDIDGDGDLDVAAVSSDTFHVLMVFENDAGVFSAGPIYVLGDSPRSIAMGDVDGDGDVDAVVGDTRGAAVVLLNSGSGAFVASAGPEDISGTPLIEDLDGDGLVDLVFRTGSDVGVGIGLGGGAFAQTTTIETIATVRDIALGDADGDGRADLFTTAGVLLNASLPGALAFDEQVYLPEEPYELAIADIDGNGRPDILVSGPEVDGVAILYHACMPTCAADLDGDGQLTIFDFLAFGNLFDLADPRADFDGNGELTIFDFLAFQNAFDAGCE